MKKQVVIAIFVGLVCLALIAIPVGYPQRVAENTVIDKAGIYESPRGTQIVNVSREDGGRLKIAVTWKKGGGGATTLFRPIPIGSCALILMTDCGLTCPNKTATFAIAGIQPTKARGH